MDLPPIKDLSLLNSILLAFWFLYSFESNGSNLTVSKLHGGLVKMQITGLYPRIWIYWGGMGLRIRIRNYFLDGTDAAGPGTTL